MDIIHETVSNIQQPLRAQYHFLINNVLTIWNTDENNKKENIFGSITSDHFVDGCKRNSALYYAIDIPRAYRT